MWFGMILNRTGHLTGSSNNCYRSLIHSTIHFLIVRAIKSKWKNTLSKKTRKSVKSKGIDEKACNIERRPNLPFHDQLTNTVECLHIWSIDKHSRVSIYLILFHDPTEDLQVHRFILSTSAHVMTYNDYSTAESTHIEAIPELEQSAKGVDVHLHPFATVIALLVSVYSPTFQLHFFFFFQFFYSLFNSIRDFYIFISFSFSHFYLVSFSLSFARSICSRLSCQ